MIRFKIDKSHVPYSVSVGYNNMIAGLIINSSVVLPTMTAAATEENCNITKKISTNPTTNLTMDRKAAGETRYQKKTIIENTRDRGQS